MSTALAIAGLWIGGGFAALAVADRLVREFCYRHTDKCRAASAALDNFQSLARRLIDDPKTPDEIVQVVVCLDDQVGHAGLARLVLGDLKRNTAEAMHHFVEFIPHDMTEDHSRSLVDLVRAAVTSSGCMTLRPLQNATTLNNVSDPVLVALVINRLDC